MTPWTTDVARNSMATRPRHLSTSVRQPAIVSGMMERVKDIQGEAISRQLIRRTMTASIYIELHGFNDVAEYLFRAEDGEMNGPLTTPRARKSTHKNVEATTSVRARRPCASPDPAEQGCGRK